MVELRARRVENRLANVCKDVLVRPVIVAPMAANHTDVTQRLWRERPRLGLRIAVVKLELTSYSSVPTSLLKDLTWFIPK